MQLGQTTLDNAGNCNTMMEEFEKLLTALGIPYDQHGNRCR